MSLNPSHPRAPDVICRLKTRSVLLARIMHSPSSMDGLGSRVLVVDDTKSITHMMEMFLSRRGFQVRTVNDSRQAIHVVREFAPEVVLLDISMPYMDGYEVARIIRLEDGFKEVPIIAVTSHSHAEHLRRARAVGIDHQMVKPCCLDNLESLIQLCCKVD